MPFVARPAPIHRHALCFELRVLIKIFPGIVLSLVGLLSLPGVLLASVVLGVRLKRRHLVEVFVSIVAHVLFCVVLCFLLLWHHLVKPFHSRLSLISFLPYKPCVSKSSALICIKISVFSTCQSRRTYPNANGRVRTEERTPSLAF